MKAAPTAIALLATSLAFAPKQLTAFQKQAPDPENFIRNKCGCILVGPQEPQPEKIRDVLPKYPKIAQAAQIQGDVVLNAIIDKKGRIKHLHVVSGPPVLAKAAMDAVKQWRYKPYKTSKKKVGVATVITVRFHM
jgi:TonB family protein